MMECTVSSLGLVSLCTKTKKSVASFIKLCFRNVCADLLNSRDLLFLAAELYSHIILSWELVIHFLFSHKDASETMRIICFATCHLIPVYGITIVCKPVHAQFHTQF
jgi:hypothetical protein